MQKRINYSYKQLYLADKKRNGGGYKLRLLKYFRRCQTANNPIARICFRTIFWYLKSIRHIEMYGQCCIGPGLYLGHVYCITINSDVIIGKNCNIHKGVTIGAENRGKRKGVPVLGDEVWIGVNSVIVGNITIGDDVLIAPNSYVNRDIPSHSVVFGNPCVIRHKDSATEGYIENKI